jgi:hypothetical protein
LLPRELFDKAVNGAKTLAKTEGDLLFSFAFFVQRRTNSAI